MNLAGILAEAHIQHLLLLVHICVVVTEFVNQGLQVAVVAHQIHKNGGVIVLGQADGKAVPPAGVIVNGIKAYLGHMPEGQV